MSDIYKKLGIPDPLLLDADGSGKLLPQSKPDQIIGPGAALTAKIVSAHQSELARLKAENLTQAEEIRRLREALEFYEDVKNYDYDAYKGQTLQDAPVGQDEGFKAREALTPTPSNWGTKALAVVEAAREEVRENPSPESALDKAVVALSELQKERTS